MNSDANTPNPRPDIQYNSSPQPWILNSHRYASLLHSLLEALVDFNLACASRTSISPATADTESESNTGKHREIKMR